MVMGETNPLPCQSLQVKGYIVCATEERNTLIPRRRHKISKFEFCKFRTYETPKKGIFNIFGYYRGIAQINKIPIEINFKTCRRKEAGTEYSTGNYYGFYMPNDKSGEIYRQIVDSTIEEAVADCKKEKNNYH